MNPGYRKLCPCEFLGPASKKIVVLQPHGSPRKTKGSVDRHDEGAGSQTSLVLRLTPGAP